MSRRLPMSQNVVHLSWRLDGCLVQDGVVPVGVPAISIGESG